jgi:hypothetical protein
MNTERASEAPVGLSVFTSITVNAMQIDTGVRMLVTSSPRSSSMLRCACCERAPMSAVDQIPDMSIMTSRDHCAKV